MLVALATASLAGCGEAADNGDRGLRAIGACRDHGGVVAFEDNITICSDQSAREVGKSPSGEDRGRRAVGACRGRGGVVAFEDDIVICRNQTPREVQE